MCLFVTVPLCTSMLLTEDINFVSLCFDLLVFLSTAAVDLNLLIYSGTYRYTAVSQH